MKLHICLIGLLIPLGARGAQIADTAYALGEITVTAARLAVPAATAPVRTQRVSTDQIQESGARTLADILTASAPLYVRRYTGGLATLSQRGRTASQTLILLDGHRIASPALGQVDLSLWPAVMLDAVEISSGSGSGLYGSDAFGGVVHLIMARAPRQWVMQGASGAWGERTAAMRTSYQRGRLGAAAGGEWFQYRGDYPYWNTGLFPPRDTRRVGGDQQRRSTFGSATWTGTDMDGHVSVWYLNADRGLPTLFTTIPRNERQWDSTVGARTGTTLVRTWGTLAASALVQTGTLRYVNPQIEVDDTGRTRTASALMEWSREFSHAWHTGVFLEAGLGRASHPNLSDRAWQHHGAWGLYARGKWRSVIIYPALRLDGYFASGSTLAASPRLGLNLGLLRQLRMKASVGRAFRMPTFNDRYWQPGGNVDLRPESGWSADAGWHWSLPVGSAELSVFASGMQDQIVWAPAAEGFWSPSNVQRVDVRGLELSADFEQELGPRLRASAGALWTYARTRASLDLRLIPKHYIRTYLAVRWHFLSARTHFQYTGQRLVSADTHAPAFVLADAQTRMHLGKLSLHAHWENLFNVRYEFIANHPMAPRHVRLGATITLD